MREWVGQKAELAGDRKSNDEALVPLPAPRPLSLAVGDIHTPTAAVLEFLLTHVVFSFHHSNALWCAIKNSDID